MTTPFDPFDPRKHDAYAAAAKRQWSGTEAYQEFEQRTAAKSAEDLQQAGDGLMQLLAGFGKLQNKDVSDPDVQQLVQAVQSYITTHFYTCTNEIFAMLGKLYAAGGDFTTNIDRAGGNGTAKFAARAIAQYCQQTR